MVDFMSTNAAIDAASGHGRAMDHNYRLQRHVYDLSRKYYLLGRDRMLDGLGVQGEGRVLEIGCGTARNLIRVGKRYPQARLYGLDISEQMLKTAGQSLQRARLVGRVGLACADAENFDAGRLFGAAQFERIYFSYALSMIPHWQQALAQAVRLLAPDGELHVVDFGSSQRLPRTARNVLWWWLARYQVSPRISFPAELRKLASAQEAEADLQRLYRDYAWIAVLKRNA